MKKFLPLIAFVALAACGSEVEEGPVEPVAEGGITDLDGDPEVFDAEAGRPFFDEAMRRSCPTMQVARVQCERLDGTTGDPTELTCEYELIDGEQQVLTARILREGEEWNFAETPETCTPAAAQG